MQKLYETYERCAGKEPPGSKPLLPIAHTTQQVHIEIVIDGDGNFRRAQLVQKEETTLPATEESAGRTSGEAPHPLCDKIQYCGGDYESFGGTKEPYFKGYVKQLVRWCESPHSHPKAVAVLDYVRKERVVADLVQAGALVAVDGKLMLYEKSKGGRKNDDSGDQIHGIFKLLTPKKEKDSDKLVMDQGDAFVRWRVESPGDLCTGTWEDESLKQAWQNYEASQRTIIGFCMIQGEDRTLAEMHPAKLRHGGDKAKLISSNDTAGFTFKGRFIDASQAAGVSFDVTQKAHSALRWLINRGQAFKSGDQVIVSWAVGGQPIPDPWGSSAALFGTDETYDPTVFSPVESDPGDIGQTFALRLKRAIAGYRANLEDTTDIVVMGLDSATPGRMAMTYYRELKGSEFLERIESWHERNAWPQNFGKGSTFIGVPSPRDIAEAAHGRRIDDKLRKSTVERLIPCIIDGMHLPRDLVDACARRAFNRVGLDKTKRGGKVFEDEWEKCLGIACALYKGFHQERGYQMALEESRKTRDYLYGQLLAVAEHIEGRALYVAGENRDTTAARLMQRFSDRPYSTWRTIELSLNPYKSRLRASRGAFLWEMEQLLDGLVHAFPTEGKEAFTNDRPLSGEFLLGYHCQRQKLREKNEDAKASSPNND